MPKYCKECKLQGHAIYECRILHPELNQRTGTDNGDTQGTSEKGKGHQAGASEGKKKEENQRINSQPTGSFPRKLASGKIIENPNDWNAVTNKKGNNKEGQINKTQNKKIGNAEMRNKGQEQSQNMIKVQNMYEELNNENVQTKGEQETLKSGAKGSSRPHTSTQASVVQSNREQNEEPSHKSVTRQEEEEQELRNQVQLRLSQEISEKVNHDRIGQKGDDESGRRIIGEENTSDGEEEKQETEVQGEGKAPIQPELSTSEEKEMNATLISTSESSATLGNKHE